MINLKEEFKKEMKDILKDEYDAFIESYNLPSYKGLRINQLKIENEALLPFELESIPWCDTGYYYKDIDQPGKHIFHEMGLYYIQEPSAMAVVEELDIKEGDYVLDMCAAPGGKSTQIGAKLNGTGLLISNEIIPSRAKILSSNIERMGIKNAIVLNETPKNIAKHFKGFFNKILVDAPCSGEGMFRKNPDAINEWSVENVEMCAERQLEILNEAAKCCADTARIVFSTCTFSNKENESVVEKFLFEHPDFYLVQSKYKFENGLDKDGLTQRIYPHKVKGEGHFFAILQRSIASNIQKEIALKPIKQSPDFTKWVKDNLNIDIQYNLTFGDNLYLAPYTKLDGLKVERPGLHLGVLKKNRFEPSHSLALAIKREDVKRIIDLKADSKYAQDVINGLTIPTDIVGWGLICVEGLPLAWFKGDGNQAKNHYPKGLRKEVNID